MNTDQNNRLYAALGLLMFASALPLFGLCLSLGASDFLIPLGLLSIGGLMLAIVPSNDSSRRSKDEH